MHFEIILNLEQFGFSKLMFHNAPFAIVSVEHDSIYITIYHLYILYDPFKFLDTHTSFCTLYKRNESET